MSTLPSLFPLAIAPACPLDAIPIVPDVTGRGAKAWDIFRRLPVTEGVRAGDRFAAGPPWQERLVKLLFGHTDAAGLRVYREAFLTLSKKNGKSSFASALVLTKVLLQEEQREFVALLAANRAQARILFDSVCAMLRADPELGALFDIVDHRHVVKFPTTSSRIVAVSAEMASLVGQNPSLACVDELHLLGGSPKGAALVNQIRTGSVARREPLLVSISTAPPERSEGIFESTLRKARAIIAGTEIDARFFGWVCEVPEGLDPEDPTSWFWSNPSLGYTLTEAALRDGLESARSDPVALAAFRSQNLNVQPDESAGAGRWMSLKVWDAAADTNLDLPAILNTSEQLFVGADCGGLDDLTALAVLGRTANDEYLLWTHQWLNQQGYAKRAATSPYDEFIAAGELTLFGDGSSDIEAVGELVAQIDQTGRLVQIGIDSFGAVGLAEALAACDAETVAVPQGWKLTPAVAWVERALADGTLRHHGSRLLRWNVGNCIVTRTGNARIISKSSAVGPRKIDGAAAMLTCAATLIAAPAPTRSIYDSQESYEAVYGRGEPAEDPDRWDPEVLKDMRHPLFAEHKRRFEQWQDARADDDF